MVGDVMKEYASRKCVANETNPQRKTARTMRTNTPMKRNALRLWRRASITKAAKRNIAKHATIKKYTYTKPKTSMYILRS